MTLGTHIIEKQILEMSMSSELATYELQEKLGQICRQQLSPLLDQLFSKLSSDGENYQFDRLELDVGLLSSDDIQKELIDKTLSQLESHLIEVIEVKKREIKEIESIKRTQLKSITGDASGQNIS